MTTAGAKALVLSAVLKSHEVMEDFLKAGFRSHPLIVKEISLFMLREWVDPLEVDGVKSDMEKLKTEIKKLSTANSDLKKTVGDLKEELKRLKDRLTSLEKKK